ncbi:MAG: hypothetical protein LBG27_06475 [Spirochaetaceae bacterium]|nr:hypothetical protein [Spirochaetaceae bacterium]
MPPSETVNSFSSLTSSRFSFVLNVTAHTGFPSGNTRVFQRTRSPESGNPLPDADFQ